MFNPNDDGPISPMKKLKILTEKQNVQYHEHAANLHPLKESLFEKKLPKELIKEAHEEPEATEVEQDNVEPLLKETINQYVIFPISHDDMWHMYKQLVDNFWSPTESLNQLEKLNLTYNEKQFMKFFSSIFASPKSRGFVTDNLAEHFCSVIQVTEAKFFYGHQLFVQNIHYEMYNQLLDSFATEIGEKEKLFKIVENWDPVINKREWLSQLEYKSFAEKLVGASCLHGLMFTSLNLIHSWLQNKMRASMGHELVDTFEKMIVDQALKRDFACLMISHLKEKPSKESILETINKAAKIEFDFLRNGIKSTELIEVDSNEIIHLIDVNTKALKIKLFNSFEDRKKINTDSENKANDTKMNRDNTTKQENESSSYKENHQKICFDEDF